MCSIASDGLSFDLSVRVRVPTRGQYARVIAPPRTSLQVSY